VDQLVEFVQPHPTGIKAEDKKHSFNQVRLARTIGTYDTREIAMKFAYHLAASIRFEVLQNHVIDY